MKWNRDLLEETVEFESRWVRVRRQIKRLLVVAFLCTLLAFLTLHPGGRRITTAGFGVGQTAWQWAERQFVHHFGPALILRLRAQWAVAKLEDELVRLQAIEVESARMAETLQEELPQLLTAREAVYQEILALTVQLQPADALAIAALPTNAPPVPGTSLRPANLSAQVMIYTDLAEQVGSRQQAVRVLTATVGQSRALQGELQQLLADAEMMRNLFTALLNRSKAVSVEPGLTAGELLAMRTALQVQLTRAQEIHTMRRALEAGLTALNLPATPPASKPTLQVDSSLTHSQ